MDLRVALKLRLSLHSVSSLRPLLLSALAWTLTRVLLTRTEMVAKTTAAVSE